MFTERDAEIKGCFEERFDLLLKLRLWVRGGLVAGDREDPYEN